MSICARCKNFSLQGSPAMAAFGLGRCAVEPILRPDMPAQAVVGVFRNATGAPECGRYIAAPDMAKRENWLKLRNAGAG